MRSDGWLSLDYGILRNEGSGPKKHSISLLVADPTTIYQWLDGCQYSQRDVIPAGTLSAIFGEWILHPILKLQPRKIASHSKHLLDQAINAGPKFVS
mmetsp:Transcript_7880/g.11416  ORF Transcript_7880/g.11416 Transcript_7880/m.11416 type:complete len:97 (-) Transcript_7880:1081-1371(-)